MCSVLIPVLSYTSVLKGSTVLCRVQVEMTNCSVRAHRLRAAAAAKHAVRCGSIAGMTAASWGPLPGLTLACMLVAIAHAHSCGPLPGLRSLSIDLDDGGRLVLGADCSFSVFHSRQGSPSNLQGCPPSTRPACRRWGQRDGLDSPAPPAHAAGGTARRPTAPGLLVGLGCRDSARPVSAGRPDVLPVPPVCDTGRAKRQRSSRCCAAPRACCGLVWLECAALAAAGTLGLRAASVCSCRSAVCLGSHPKLLPHACDRRPTSRPHSPHSVLGACRGQHWPAGAEWRAARAGQAGDLRCGWDCHPRRLGGQSVACQPACSRNCAKARACCASQGRLSGRGHRDSSRRGGAHRSRCALVTPPAPPAWHRRSACLPLC